MYTIATTSSSFVTNDPQTPLLPPFSLPQGNNSHSETMTPNDALKRMNGAQSGFIGDKFAILVANTLS